MTQPATDVLIIMDPRFMGGTATAVASDVRTFQAAGVSVALHFVRCHGYFQPHETPNSDLLALCDLPGVSAAAPDAPVRAGAAFFHHPVPFQNGVENPIEVNAEQAVIITHQAPFKGDGALDYDPFLVQRQIRNQFGIAPLWTPISGVSRAQLRSFSPLLRLTQIDWPNTFHVSDWQPKREKLTTPHLTVGRHGRPHAEKWGDSAADIADSLPAGPHTHIRTMGTERAFFDDMAIDTEGWDILPFNGEPVPDFLDSLDVFSYFHASTWTETFGRTVAEAMLMGARCVLDPALKPTFGTHALYCTPGEVAGLLDHIRHDLAGSRAAAENARAFAMDTYATDSVPDRLAALKADTGTVSQRGGASASPFTTARKWTGFHRRRRNSLRSA